MTDNKDLAVFEKRAQEAEKQIELLTKKVEEIELAQMSNDSPAETQRQTHAASTESKDASIAGDTATITIARDEALKDNKAVKLQIEKLNYRILHLVKALEEEERKHSSK